MGYGCIFSRVTLIGTISISEDGDGNLTGVYLPNSNLPVMDVSESEVISEAFGQIDEYLCGKRKKFDLPLDYGCTGFRRTVLEEVEKIPYGETRTYKEVAVSAGSPKAFMAVGSVCASNPLPIIIPCHRVLPASGGIGNYAGGEALKKRLLDHEKSMLRSLLRAQLPYQPLDLVGVLRSDPGALALEERPSPFLALLLEVGGRDRDELAVLYLVRLEEHGEHVLVDAEDDLV
jgi:methylated-DNA-[protein]-cysteine S-methyltransferase